MKSGAANLRVASQMWEMVAMLRFWPLYSILMALAIASLSELERIDPVSSTISTLRVVVSPSSFY